MPKTTTLLLPVFEVLLQKSAADLPFCLVFYTATIVAAILIGVVNINDISQVNNNYINKENNEAVVQNRIKN